jgi:queuine tRNA-ribosyltransferase
MPVGTQGTVKGLTPDHVASTGAEMVLANTYHLALRPGSEVVEGLGGLHSVMGWPGPILTDSGGFQIVSLSDRVKIDDRAAVFQSHLDGSTLVLTPERAITIQQQLGADVAMCLDHCPRLPATQEELEAAVDRTLLWAKRCKEVPGRDDQGIFGIVQGGIDPALRERCARTLVELDFEGYAVGGVSVGESPEDMRIAIEATTQHLPTDKVRYLMGVGRPEDLLDAVAMGIDIFDCVLPTRNGRNAHCLANQGVLKLRNACFKLDSGPIEVGCQCLACRTFSRGAIRHFFLANEMLGPILASIHNLYYLQSLMQKAREAISQGRYVQFRSETLAMRSTSRVE